MRIMKNKTKIKDIYTELTETHSKVLDNLLRRSLFGREDRQQLVESQVVAFNAIHEEIANIREEAKVLEDSKTNVSEKLRKELDVLVFNTSTSIIIINDALTLFLNAKEEDIEAKFNKFLYKLIQHVKSITRDIEHYKKAYL